MDEVKKAGMRSVDISLVCHQANKALCEIFRDTSQVDYMDAPAWQRASTTDGVDYCLAASIRTPSAQHAAWMEYKISEGWRYGAVKNPDAKEHPCLVPFDQLPPEQKAKDCLFVAIVNALAPFVI